MPLAALHRPGRADSLPALRHIPKFSEVTRAMSAALSLDDWKTRAETLSFRSQAFINGRYVDSASGKTFECVNPATGRVLTKVAAGDKEDVDRAAKAARAAFEKGSWSRMAPAQRKKRLQKFADLIDKHATELALLETLDMG
jgi:delta 1-pyrroline-5-carboxylate dehydrogenase